MPPGTIALTAIGTPRLFQVASNPADALDKMIYAFANPSAADLVETLHDWPGAHSLAATLSGGSISVARPKGFFRDEGSMPAVVTLTFERPIGLEDVAPKDWIALVKSRLREAEAAHRARRRVAGKTVLGRRRVLAQSPLASPRTIARRFQVSPKIAAKSKWARIEAILREKDFIDRHRQAFLGYIAGLANIVFPFGTYWWRKFGRLPCEGDSRSSLAPCPS